LLIEVGHVGGVDDVVELRVRRHDGDLVLTFRRNRAYVCMYVCRTQRPILNFNPICEVVPQG
jgi:hypothetical protein